MPRKKRTSTTEKTSTKDDAKSSSVTRSKSRPAKPKREPVKTRNAAKALKSKSTGKRGRPAGKSKAAVATEDRSKESSVSSASPEKSKKTSKKSSSNIEKSASKSKKQQSEKVESGRVTRTSAKSKTRGRPASKSKASKSTSKQTKAKDKGDKEEIQSRSTRKTKKTEKKQEEEEEKSFSPEEEIAKPVINTPKRRKQAKEPKSQAVQATPVTERTRTRVKGVLCKKEDIEENEEKKEKGKSKKKEKEKEKEKKEIPSRAQAKLFQKKIKKEEKELPRFPTTDASIEGLIVEAIKGLKTKAMEDRIIGYLGKRFSDVDGNNIKSVLEKMQIDEKLLLKGISGKQVKCGKRSPDRSEVDSLEGTPKKIKTSRNSSPLGRFEARNTHTHTHTHTHTQMEVETNKGEEKNKTMEEEEKPVEIEIKEEADKKLQESPVVVPEEKDIVLSLTASNSKKALIEYYEMKILKIKGLLTEKKEKKPELIQNPVCHNQMQDQTTQGGVEGQTQGQQEEPKREEQEEQTGQQTVRRFEVEEQMTSEKKNLSFDKESINMMSSTNRTQGQEEKRKDCYMESEEKIEEDEGRGMVIWEVQENSEAEKNLNMDSIKEAGQENNIELLMKLLAMPGVVQAEPADEQKIEESQLQRVVEEKKVEESGEKIEDVTVYKDGGQCEENSTKTEPKLEEQEQKAEEGAQKAKNKNGESENRESISKKMRSAVEDYLEMLQGRKELDCHADNRLSTSEEEHQEKNINKEKIGEEKIVQDNEKKKEEENNVKEESDQEKPQKLSVSKFLT